MRYLITFSYDGTNYNGYQSQPDGNTIQDKIEQCLYKINGNKEIKIHATGRTDSHVHALNQRAHFDLDGDFNEFRIKRSLNGLLPSDIYIKKVEKVSDDFHARFDIKKKEYMYIINLGEYNPLERNYVYQFNSNLDVDKMKRAINDFIGTHNFKAFTKVDGEKEDYKRTIYEARIEEDKEYLRIYFVGSGFLRYMVRNMVGTLLEIGTNKKDVNSIPIILKSCDRNLAGVTAPPEGLYLKDVFY